VHTPSQARVALPDTQLVAETRADAFVAAAADIGPPVHDLFSEDSERADHDDTSPPEPDADPRALFIASLQLPIPESLVHMPLRSRTSCKEPASLVPCRSERLAPKYVFHDPNPEKQAKRVLVNKWECRPDESPIVASDGKIAELFHETFKAPVDSPTREALHELLFPSPCEWSSNAAMSTCSAPGRPVAH
jgi:hypothetical protein